MGSFDRKVERNMVKLKKKGKNPVIKSTTGGGSSSNYSIGPKGDGDVFKGRKIVLPTVLSLLAILYGLVGIISPAAEGNTTIFWVTIGLYLLLALVIFLRKPYLRIDRNKLFTSSFNRDKLVDANNISKIIVSRKKIVIIVKGKGANWVFYRLRNRFDTDAMAIRLEQFAISHQVAIEKQ